MEIGEGIVGSAGPVKTVGAQPDDAINRVEPGRTAMVVSHAQMKQGPVLISRPDRFRPLWRYVPLRPQRIDDGMRCSHCLKGLGWLHAKIVSQDPACYA